MFLRPVSEKHSYIGLSILPLHKSASKAKFHFANWIMEDVMQINAMEWGAVNDIDDVVEFNAKDEECFKELRDVLAKHGALDRFGINLIHKHFDLEDDEEMVEFTDHENRMLVIKPMKKTDLAETPVTVTNWQLCEGEKVARRVCTCARTNQGHTGGHVAV